MNERGFPAITAARSSVARLFSSYFRPDLLRFRSFLRRSLPLRSEASFQLPLSLRSRLHASLPASRAVAIWTPTPARQKVAPSPTAS